MQSAVFFNYERLSDVLLQFGSGVTLKLIVELGNKDKNGNKISPIEEYEYPSNKYLNVSKLISMKRKFKSYLVIEYPSQDNTTIGNKFVYIRDYSIMGLLSKMKEFDNNIEKGFAYKRNKLILLSDSITPVISYPTDNSRIEFIQDIYYTGPDKDIPKLGVQIGLNEEYYFTIPALTIWKSFLYYIDKCDLYEWGSVLLSSYTNRVIGNNINSIGENNYRPNRNITENPDDISDELGAGISHSKPLNKNESIKGFFDDDFK